MNRLRGDHPSQRDCVTPSALPLFTLLPNKELNSGLWSSVFDTFCYE